MILKLIWEISCPKIKKKIFDKLKITRYTSRGRNAEIAQSVEQRTENPCVPGSNPGLGTTIVSTKGLQNYATPFLFIPQMHDIRGRQYRTS